MNLSFWEKEELSRHCDVLIIGGGIVGLSAALAIKKARPNYTVEVLEGQPYGALASSRNAGFACFGSVSEILADMEKYGEEETLRWVKKRRSGIKKLKRLYGEHIDYQETGGCEVFAKAEEYEIQASRIKEVNKCLGNEVFHQKNIVAGIRLHDRMIENNEEGQLNTGRLYSVLSLEVHQLGVVVIRNTEVQSIQPSEGVVNFGVRGHDIEIEKSASQILLSTNALTKDLLEDEDVTPVRNQVLITDPIADLSWQGCYHQDRGYIYFRNVGKRILIGGARNLFETEATNQLGINKENQSYLENYINSYLNPSGSEIKVHHRWSGILSGGMKRSPIVKRVTDRVVVAARLSGMGVAIGLDIGEEAATLLLS